ADRLPRPHHQGHVPLPLPHPRSRRRRHDGEDHGDVMRKLLFFTAVLVALAGSVADARDHLTGIVLMAPSATTVMVHHEAFAGMPAMTMDFSIPAGTVVHPGDHIAADVDRSTEPWSLSEVHVTA